MGKPRVLKYSEKAYKTVLRQLDQQREREFFNGCLRCGLETMKPRLATNAMSRLEDVWVCDRCGVNEAMDEFAGTVLEIPDWYVFQSVENNPFLSLLLHMATE